MKIKFSLKYKIIFYTIALFALIAGSSGYFGYESTKSFIIERREDEFITTVKSEALKISEIFSYSEDLAATIAAEDQVIDFAASSSKAVSLEQIIESLDSFNIGKKYSAIYLMDQTGLTVASTDPRFMGQNYGFRYYFQQAVAGEAAMDMALDTTSKEPGYYFFHPVKKDGAVSGVLVVKLIPNIIQRHEAIGHTKEHIHMILNRYGVIVDSDDESRIFTILSEPGQRVRAELQTFFANTNFRSLGYDAVYDNLSAIDKEARSFRVTSNPGDEDRVFVVGKIPEQPFYYAMEAHLEYFYEGLNKIISNIFILVTLAVILAFILLYFVIYLLLKPLAKLELAAQEVEKGNYNYRLEIKTGDELQHLAEAFNRMTSATKNSFSEIEKKVKEQTKELVKNQKTLENKIKELESWQKNIVNRELKMVELKKEIANLKKELLEKNKDFNN